jgi:hypothetical protein
MTLLTGTWKINANGFEGDLNIDSVDSQGNLSGTVFGNNILGFWDDVAMKITFIRVVDPSNPSTFQIYTGFLFQNPTQPDAGDNVTFTLTGSFEAFSGTGAVAQRVVYGWFAQIVKVG